MKSLAISVKKRENVGKSDSKALRNQGKVPCVLYGGEKQVCFYAHENDLRKLVYTPDVFLVDLDIEGTKTSCILQDIQFHPVTDKILHIDFLEVFADKEVTVEIPVVLTGMAIGVRNGGNLLTRRNKIITRAIPGNLPDAIEIDISELKIGMFIYIKDLKSDKYSFLASDNSVVVGVKTARAAIEEEVEDEVEGEEGEEGTPSEGSGDQSTDTDKEDK
ncbi:50S ribosomal protein L25/general stress protein Ctc [Flavobacteriales bacterium]|jgi:large subunit ribosomal protein L25|nr:50S ribosomal protein L25/general stress protein Ctc [Flavobacteriales bacterium]